MELSAVAMAFPHLLACVTKGHRLLILVGGAVVLCQATAGDGSFASVVKGGVYPRCIK
eukprot:COSAG05_NODE_1768_length_4117_cov_3.170732_2_plen_58_part_00